MADPREWIEKADALLASVSYPELVEAGVLLPDDRWLPVITYPPITMYPPQEPETLLATAEEWRGDRPRALYAHIPFCRFCCHYCHWVKRINPSRDEVDRYADLLIREADVVRGWLGVEKLSASSILFGGGTPTLLDAAQLDSLLSRFLDRVDLSGCRQFSFEAEPASILGEQGAAKLAVLKSHGVDRISIGVQSFEDHVLRGMGRSHDGAEALASIEAVRRAGIPSVSIDLIYGCKDQTIEDWLRSLDTAVASGADAWQLYRLRIERHGDMQGKVLDQFRGGRDRFADLHTVRRMKALGVVRSMESGRQEHFTRIFATAQEHVTQYMWDYCCDLADVIP
ncbi:MAG: radical SAM protein, partial [Deltaproteobacteria bacterium]|nr:radical SAM protein [Deltaproteobacteria bacterium]